MTRRPDAGGTDARPGAGAGAGPKGAVRCAIYTRKSTEEGLQQEFNSLDHQREAAEAYIKSQQSEGWVCVPDRYDDGGFTGGNMDRPALKRLLIDIEAGRIDCVMVYKVDRLSRSLIDFARMMELFEGRKVSFVAVTQQINTGTSMGRLMLNVLLSFAQFERELVSERTRDKIAAARRKGKWSGGYPPLGYDVVKSPAGSKLVINEEEAQRVRQIFILYMEHQGMVPMLIELDRRGGGWTSKSWTTSKGKPRGGRPFDKYALFMLLKNQVYIGKVKHKQQVYDGEHPAIVDPEIFQRVQDLLQVNGRGGGMGRKINIRQEALLKGILRCRPCGCSMGPTYASKGPPNVRYRYYLCLKASKRGWRCCQSKSVPAQQIEQFVIDRVRAAVKDINLDLINEPEQQQALRSLNGPGWDKLPLAQQSRILRLLIQQVEYDGGNGTVWITFRSDGIAHPIEPKEAAA